MKSENIKLSKLPKEKVTVLFVDYFKLNHPEKLKFNPRIIEYNDEVIRFGMNKHQGVFVIAADTIII